MVLDDETREALEAALPARQRVLRATQAYLLPEDVRLGFELSMVGVRDGLLDEAMQELERSPLEVLARALLQDLEVAVAAAEEVSRDAVAGSLERHEIQVAAAVADISRLLLQHLPKLRAALGEEAGEG